MTELTPKQQVVDIIKNNQKFLILIHRNPDGDAIGSSLALFLLLKRLKKDVSLVCPDNIPEIYNFLSGEIANFSDNFSRLRDFILSVDIKEVKAGRVSYRVEGDKLNIVVTPKEGEFKPEMVSFPEGKLNFDALIVLDCTDLERLGQVREENADAFFEVPVINIDHHAGNDHFGRVNLVDLTATSTAEILVSVFEALTGDAKFADEEIATLLLCGIITDTNSFQNTNTTPKSLTVAAQLVAQGGRQQDIIKNIYKTKPLSTLRLWGRALANINDEKSYCFIWSKLYKKDYLDVEAKEEESGGLIDELLKTALGVDFALLLSEKNGEVHGSLRATNKACDVSPIANLFGGGGHNQAAAFQLANTTLLESCDKIIKKIKTYQKEQLSLGSKKAESEVNPIDKKEAAETSQKLPASELESVS